MLFNKLPYALADCIFFIKFTDAFFTYVIERLFTNSYSNHSMVDRHQFRAKWHDYNSGIYFVTICAHEKQHLFGKISEGIFSPSEIGCIIKEHLYNLSSFYADVELLNCVIMPNHIHLVTAVGTRFFASPQTTAVNFGCLKHSNHGVNCGDFHHNSRLASIIGAFKAGVSRSVRTRRIASLPVWQSRYHEHIIRDQRAFDNIMNYINSNVENWHIDCFKN